MSEPTTYVQYNGKRLIPAPFLSFTETHRMKDSREIVGSDLTVQLSGNILACRGFDFTSGSPELYSGSSYPSSDSDCCKFDNLLNAKEAFEEHFAVDQNYKDFSVQEVGKTAKTWKGRIVSLTFSEGKWLDYLPYSILIELQASTTSTIGSVASWPDDNLLNIDENWSIEFREDQVNVYALTHSLTCQAKDYYSGSLTEGWKKAKEWMTSRLAGSDYTGSSPTQIKNNLIFNSTGFNLTTYTAYNYEKDQIIDELNGTFTINERWELAEDPVLRELNVSVAPNLFDEDVVTVEGTYRSLLETDESNPDAARTAFDSWIASTGHYTVANEFYGYAGGTGTLNTTPHSSSIRYFRDTRGTGNVSTRRTRQVGFSYNFETSQNCNASVFRENITVTKTKPSDTIAIIGVLGRGSYGPVIQNKNMKTPERIQINIEWQYTKQTGTGCPLALPSGVETAVQSVVTSVAPCVGSSGSYLESDTETWVPKRGSYTRSLGYICEECS